jgi:hypothetical protein
VRHTATKKQPKPKRNKHPIIGLMTIGDMMARMLAGKKKYGTYLQPYNGRDTLLDLYEELLDAAIYCRTLMYERDGK